MTVTDLKRHHKNTLYWYSNITFCNHHKNAFLYVCQWSEYDFSFMFLHNRNFLFFPRQEHA